LLTPTANDYARREPARVDRAGFFSTKDVWAKARVKPPIQGIEVALIEAVSLKDAPCLEALAKLRIDWECSIGQEISIAPGWVVNGYIRESPKVR